MRDQQHVRKTKLLVLTLTLALASACSSVVDESSLATSGLQLGKPAQECFTPSADSTLDSSDPSANWGSGADCQVDARPHKWCVLRWDLSSIPPGRQVESAFVELHIEDSSRSSYVAQALLQPWDEAQVTWQNARIDRAPGKLFKFRGHSGTHTTFVTEAGLAQVQAWVDAPATNFGIIIRTRDVHRMALISKEGSASNAARLCVNYH